MNRGRKERRGDGLMGLAEMRWGQRLSHEQTKSKIEGKLK